MVLYKDQLQFMQFFNNHIIDKIRKGYYSAAYFDRTQQILLRENNIQTVTMQIFQKKDTVLLCGIDEVIELLQIGTGYFSQGTWVNKYSKLTVEAVPEGSMINATEPIMHIAGPYAYFAHLESLYLGILARRTSVATKVKDVVAVANNKPILFFADRFDYFLTQEGDGYAANKGGAAGVATPAQAFLWNGKPIGTIPHALIAAYHGDTVRAAQAFSKHFPEVPLVALVDFTNDCIATALAVAQALGSKLWGIRLDTSESMIDASLKKYTHEKQLYGVNPTLVKKVREALDKANFQHVKIIVSGGFNTEKVAFFEKEQTPVDMYGIGSWFLQGTNPFTADIVTIGGNHQAKEGRSYKQNPLMRQAKYEK